MGLQPERMWTPPLFVSLCFLLSHLLSQVHRRQKQGGEQEGRLRLDEEVLDAPEELRQPVVGVGGAHEEQGQERLALCTS